MSLPDLHRCRRAGRDPNRLATEAKALTESGKQVPNDGLETWSVKFVPSTDIIEAINHTKLGENGIIQRHQ